MDFPGFDFLESGGNIAAQLSDFEIRAERKELRASS
jgi:hypothetical protein